MQTSGPRRCVRSRSASTANCIPHVLGRTECLLPWREHGAPRLYRCSLRLSAVRSPKALKAEDDAATECRRTLVSFQIEVKKGRMEGSRKSAFHSPLAMMDHSEPNRITLAARSVIIATFANMFLRR